MLFRTFSPQLKKSWHKPEVRIQSYIEAGLTAQQAANKLASYFSAISQTVDPLDQSQFPPALRQVVDEGRTGAKPVLTQQQVYCKIMRVTKPKSSVKGDVQRVLLNRYPYEYAKTASVIFNRIIQS